MKFIVPKECSVCGEVKKYVNKNNWCRECNAEYSRNYYWSNPKFREKRIKQFKDKT